MRTPEPGKQVSARTVRVGAGPQCGVPATLHEPMTSQFVAGTTRHEPPVALKPAGRDAGLG